MEIKEKVKLIVSAKIPVILVGPPGVGKNFLLREISEELGLKYLVLEGTSILRDDVNGLSIVDSGKTIMTPSWILNLVEKQPTLLVIDELTSMKEEIQTSLHGLFHSQERRVGSFNLPDHVHIAATGNDDGDHVIGITTPIQNRSMIIELRKPTEPKYRTPILNSFLSLNRDFFFSIPKEDMIGPWPTPRTWSIIDELLQKYDLDKVLELGAYAVGNDAIIQFKKFVTEQKYDLYNDPIGWALHKIKKGENKVKILKEIFDKKRESFIFVFKHMIETDLLSKKEYSELVKEPNIISFLNERDMFLQDLYKGR